MSRPVYNRLNVMMMYLNLVISIVIINSLPLFLINAIILFLNTMLMEHSIKKFDVAIKGLREAGKILSADHLSIETRLKQAQIEIKSACEKHDALFMQYSQSTSTKKSREKLLEQRKKLMEKIGGQKNE